MRTIFLYLALAAATLAAQTIQVSGRVLTDDGKPIEAVQISLRAPTAGSTPVVTRTNAQGAFAIEYMSAGRYSLSLSAAKPGFITYQTQLTESRTALEIRLTPASSISGRVTDSDGNPIPKAPVTAYRYMYIRGARSLNPAGYTIATDSNGVYTFPNLTAGRYYLRVEAAPSGVVTYYPSTLDPAAAAAVDIDTAASRSGVDIRQMKAPVFHIRGKAVTASGEPAPNTSLQILAEQAIETLAPPRPPQMGADGSFEFTDLLPGRYTIRAIPGQNAMVAGQMAPARFSGRTTVTITRDNLDDFRFIVTDVGYSLGGRIKMSDDSVLPIPPPDATVPLDSSFSGLRTILIDAEQTFSPGNLSASAAPQGGAFRIENIVPGKYYVNVIPRPPNVYIKSVHFDGQDVTRSQINLMYGGGDNLEIVLGADGGTVNAIVHDRKGEPVPRIRVALWPDKPDMGNQTSSIRVGTTDQQGTVRFTGLRPEKYRMAAFLEVEEGFVRSPDFLDRFRDSSAQLEVNGAASLERNLDPISRDDAARVIRNLR